MKSVLVFVVALVHAFEPPVEGFPTIRAEHGAFALEAVALLPSRETRAQLRGIVLAGTAKATPPCRAAQAHAHGMMHQRRREVVHAEAAMSAVLAT